MVLTDIPESTPFLIYDGNETAPIGYSFQTDNYSVILNEFGDEKVNTSFFTGNRIFSYKRSGAEAHQTDRLFFDGGVSVINPDAQMKIIKLANVINENVQEKLTVVRSIELAQNDSIKIDNPDSNKVRFVSYGTAKNYDIELNYVTENGIGRFGSYGVALFSNTSHTFIPDWINLSNSQLMVFVDFGNVGTIDDTLYLIVQALITRWNGAVFVAYFRNEMQGPQGGLTGLARREWDRVTSVDELRKLVRMARQFFRSQP